MRFDMPSSKGIPTDPELRDELKEGKLNLTLGSPTEISANFGQISSRRQTRTEVERGNGLLGR